MKSREKDREQHGESGPSGRQEAPRQRVARDDRGDREDGPRGRERPGAPARNPKERKGRHELADERHDRPPGQLEAAAFVQRDGGASVGEVVVARDGDGARGEAGDRRNANSQDDQSEDDPRVAAGQRTGQQAHPATPTFEACRRERGRTSTPLTRHRLLRPARLPFRHSPAAKSSAPRSPCGGAGRRRGTSRQTASA